MAESGKPDQSQSREPVHRSILRWSIGQRDTIIHEKEKHSRDIMAFLEENALKAHAMEREHAKKAGA